MIHYNPPKRLVELGHCLQFDTQYEPCFKPHERHAINVERARIMAGDDSVEQQPLVEQKIQAILQYIQKNRWRPLEEIRYTVFQDK